MLSSNPFSTRPGWRRQAGCVAVEVCVGGARVGVGVCGGEFVGGRGICVAVVMCGFDGEQAVMNARSVRRIAGSFFA